MITKNRDNLLKMLMEKNLSQKTHLLCSGKLKGLSDNIKEDTAGQMLAMLQESKTEQEFLSKLKLLDT